MDYFFTKKVELSFDNSILKITEELAKEGFGLLTRIDLDKKFKEKLNIDFRKYAILGFCNPSFAYKAIQVDDKIGIMLPCNVILQELDENISEISVVNPISVMQPVNNPSLDSFGIEVTEKLLKALNKLSDFEKKD